MSSTTPKPNGEAAPAPPVFSYAQAAKGRATATTASAMQSHQAAVSGNAPPAKESGSTIDTPSIGSEGGDRSVNGSYETLSKVEIPDSSRNPDVKNMKAGSPATSPSFGTASTSTLPKEDKEDDFTLVGGSESNRDRHSHGAGERHADGEGRRGKKGKKEKKTTEKDGEKEKEKEKEEVKPEIFVPAPLPTVNFWQQRKEDAAKSKPNSVTRQGLEGSNELNSTPNTKSIDNKKRAKSAVAEQADKMLSPAQVGAGKDAQISSKAQKKGSEVVSKKDDTPKRSGPRGSRAAEKDERPVASQLPPPVEDAMSWPTPETAVEEEKRKAQEKVDKDDKEENAPNKPRTKEKWVHVPYIPSVTFNTPLPTRGGRGRGGARGGRTEAGGRSSHVTNGAGEKPQNGSASADGDARSSSVPPTTKSRPPNESTMARKASLAQAGDKSKSGSVKTEQVSHIDIQYAPQPGQPNHFEPTQEQRLPPGETNKHLKQDQMQGSVFDNQAYPSAGNGRKGEQKGSEHFKENPFGKDSTHPNRDRNDARGRGGFRGRVAHAGYTNGQPHPQNVFANGHVAPNGYPGRQSSGPYSPPLQSIPFGNQYAPPPSRGGRGNRSQSIPNNGMYGRYPPNGVSQHMPPLQTSNQMYEYQHMQGPMSATPYQPYMDQVSVLAMVSMQLEYYFSIDNLCKDVFLRKHMDSQGFVFLAFIAGFKRIQALTHEFELLRFACHESEIIELVRGDDGHDRLRRREGWEKFVVPMDERDESVRNAGPSSVQHRSPQPPNSQHTGSMGMPNQHIMSPGAFSPNGTEASLRYQQNGAGPVSNGNGSAYYPETPLSAAVPDFAPGLLSLSGLQDPLEAATTFNDEEVAKLTLVFKTPKGSEDSKPKSPFNGAPARTFSNGSIDGRSIVEELCDDQRQGRTLTNGSPETSPESLRRSRSPFTPLSPTQSTSSNGPPVMWVKGQGQQSFVSPGNSEELYTTFRSRALNHRENSTSGETHSDMKLLYEFWSHFLCRNFNAKMYTEFRQYAFEDAQQNAMDGTNSLISYYAEILSSKKKVIPDVLALHYVELVKSEDVAGPRPALEKLRVAWRDGALDMKSRKKIGNLVDKKLKDELDRAPHAKAES
ncbi:hypothetical protein LZ554_005122 [Drepanopeziza brunnea f. sp. 'monogermtubi']|nr:hypothetical protein LZ554_005122 [Drepanopeziza brunnea f. sp. 'monogermtubi']